MQYVAPTFGSGSIPARAGEPFASLIANRLCQVYPRACGGTFYARPLLKPSQGLSPRVRGNLQRNDHHWDYWGSIPARAGEPTRKWLTR